MTEEPIRLLDPETSIFNSSDRIYRDGTELEKGVMLSENWLKNNEDLLYDYWEKFSAYPDVFLDSILPTESTFTLFPY